MEKSHYEFRELADAAFQVGDRVHLRDDIDPDEVPSMAFHEVGIVVAVKLWVALSVLDEVMHEELVYFVHFPGDEVTDDGFSANQLELVRG